MRGLAYKWQVLAVIAVGTFMVVLDNTIVNIALPRVISVFGVTVDQAQLVLTGYMLALAVIMPTTAYLSQTFGTKRVYLFTLAMFTIGSMLCGASWSLGSLIVARVLQGLGGGLIQPLGMGMLFQVTREDERGSVMGVYALPVMVAPILGPTLGGYLTEYADWRWVFYINAPVGALGVILGILLLRETPTRPGLKLDIPGFLLAALCTGPALLAASDAPTYGWSDPLVALRLAISAISLPLFIWWELHTEQPLVELRLFARPAFALGAVVNLVTASALFGAIFLLPVFLQSLRGLGAMEAGLLLVPQALGSIVGALLTGRLYDRIGPRPLIIAGLLGLAASTALLARLDLGTPDSTLRWVLVLRGFSMIVAMMPAMTAWQAAAPRHLIQAASSLNNVFRQLFAAYATAAYATLLASRTDFHYEALRMFVHPDSPMVVRMLAQGQQYALAHGLSLMQARTSTIVQMYSQIQLSAMVRSFDDCFLIAAVSCLLGAIPALFMSRPPRAAPAAAAAAD